MPERKKKLDDLIRRRNRCKAELDRIQAALNERLLEYSPVQKGDILRDEDGTIFKVVGVTVRTVYQSDGEVSDQLAFDLKRKQVTEEKVCWKRMVISTTDLSSRVLSGRAKVIHRANVNING